MDYSQDFLQFLELLRHFEYWHYIIVDLHFAIIIAIATPIAY